MTPTDLVADLPAADPPLKRLWADLGAAVQFLQTGLRRFDKNASLFPSSRFLVDAMVSATPLESARCVVELGPGTGVVTRAILRALPAEAHLHAIELDGELLETTTRLVNDPRLRPIHGSAADAPALLRARGCPHGASVVFSSLGLALMHDRLRDSILQGARGVLQRDGVFVQYLYPHARMITYQFGQGWSRFDGRAYLAGQFREIDSRLVVANVPPATVYACREPLRLRKQALSHDRARRRRRRAEGSGRR